MSSCYCDEQEHTIKIQKIRKHHIQEFFKFIFV